MVPVAPAKHLFHAENIPFSWIHSLNIQPFPCLMHFSQKLELSQEQRSACRFSSRPLVFRLALSHISNCIHTLHYFFFWKYRWLWELYRFSGRYCVHGWLVCLSIFFCLPLSSWLYSCKRYVLHFLSSSLAVWDGIWWAGFIYKSLCGIRTLCFKNVIVRSSFNHILFSLGNNHNNSYNKSCCYLSGWFLNGL